ATFPPSELENTLNTPNLAKLFKADLATETLTEIFDFGRYEVVNNPDGGDVVSNPYDLAIKGDKAYVVDGGGNVSYEINLDGTGVIATALPRLIVENPEFPAGFGAPQVNPLGNGDEIEDAVDGGTPTGAPPAGAPPTTTDGQPEGRELPGLFQPVPGNPNAISIQSVSTGNAIGPDGALYVGEYTGFPYPEGKARIFRIGEDGVPKVYAEGFTQITDIEFDQDGNLLVLEFSDQAPWKGGDIRSQPSSLIEVAPDGTRTVLVAPGEGLESADGISIGPDGSIYIANKAIGPNLGQIIRLDGLLRNNGKDVKSVPEPMSVVGLLVFGALGGSALKKKYQ
ncbi:MAG: ScyD/ScyE family protein, partial [Phormidesmis sp.]